MYSSSYYRYIHINVVFIISHNKHRNYRSMHTNLVFIISHDKHRNYSSMHTNLVFLILQHKVRSFVICFGYYISFLYKYGNPVTDFASPVFIT
jgi:hypothetical protein